MTQRSFISHDMRDEIVRRAINGERYREIADDLGVSQAAVCQAALAAGVRRNGPNASAPQPKSVRLSLESMRDDAERRYEDAKRRFDEAAADLDAINAALAAMDARIAA